MEKPNKEDRSPLTKEKMEVYEIAFAMVMKLILILAGLVAFFIVLYFIITEKDNTSKMVYGVLDLLLGGTIYLVYRHYFPDKK